MELGTFSDFFKNQQRLSISLPTFYFKPEQKWEFVEILPGLIINSPASLNDYIKIQENNVLHNYIKAWVNSILLGLEWKHHIECQKCIENIQHHIDNYYHILKGPTNITRASVTRT